MKPLDVRAQERVVEQWKVDPTAVMFNAQKIREEEKAFRLDFENGSDYTPIRLLRHGGGTAVPPPAADSSWITGNPEIIPR